MPRSVAVVVVVALLSACTQGATDPGDPGTNNDGSAASTTTTLGRLGLEQATLEFSACMRTQGIDTPDLRVDAQGRPILEELRTQIDTTSKEFAVALTECAPILTQAGALDLRRDPELQAVIVSQLTAFSECVRVEGLEDFPDPDPAFSGIGSPYAPDEVPYSDPDFEEVIAFCQESLGAAVLNQE